MLWRQQGTRHRTVPRSVVGEQVCRNAPQHTFTRNSGPAACANASRTAVRPNADPWPRESTRYRASCALKSRNDSLPCRKAQHALSAERLTVRLHPQDPRQLCAMLRLLVEEMRRNERDIRRMAVDRCGMRFDRREGGADTTKVTRITPSVCAPSPTPCRRPACAPAAGSEAAPAAATVGR